MNRRSNTTTTMLASPPAISKLKFPEKLTKADEEPEQLERSFIRREQERKMLHQRVGKDKSNYYVKPEYPIMPPKTPPIEGYIPDIPEHIGVEDTFQQSMDRATQRRQHELDNQNRRSPISKRGKKHVYDEKKDGLTNYVAKPIPTRYSSKLLLSQSEKNAVPGSRAQQILALRRSEIAGHDAFNSGMRVSESLSQLRERLEFKYGSSSNNNKSLSFGSKSTTINSSNNDKLPNLIRASASVPTLTNKKFNKNRRRNNHRNNRKKHISTSVNKHNNNDNNNNNNNSNDSHHHNKYSLKTKISSAPKTREQMYEEYKKGKHRKVPVIKPGLPYRGLRSKKKFPSGYATKKGVVEYKHLYRMEKSEADTIQDYHDLTDRLGLLSMNVTGHVQEEDSDLILSSSNNNNKNNQIGHQPENNSSILQNQRNNSSIISNNNNNNKDGSGSSGLLYRNSAIPPSTIGERQRRNNNNKKSRHKMNSNYVKADPLSGSISRESSKGGGWWKNYDDGLLIGNDVNDSSFFDSEQDLNSSTSRPQSQGPFHFLFFDDKGREEMSRTPYERASFCPASPHGRRVYWEESVGHTVSLQMNGRAFSANHRPYSSSYILPPNTSKWGKQSEGSVYGPDIVETVVISAPSHDKLLVAPLADPRSRESMRDPSFQLSLNETVDPPSPPQRINTSDSNIQQYMDVPPPHSADPMMMAMSNDGNGNGYNNNNSNNNDNNDDNTFLTSGGLKLVKNENSKEGDPVDNNGKLSPTTAVIGPINDLSLEQFKPAKLFDQASIVGWDARSEASDGRNSRPTSSGSLGLGNVPKNQKDAFDDHDGTSLSRIEEIEETNTLHEIKGRHRRSTKSKFCKLKMGIDVYVRLAQISGRQVTASEKVMYIPNGTTLLNMLNFLIKHFALNRNLIWAVEHLRPGSSVWTPIENNNEWQSTFSICSSMIQTSKRKVILRVRRHPESSGFVKKADGKVVNTPGSLQKIGGEPQRQSIREDVPTAMLSAKTFKKPKNNNDGGKDKSNSNNNNNNINNNTKNGEFDFEKDNTNSNQKFKQDVQVALGGNFDIDTLEKQPYNSNSSLQLQSPTSPVWDEMGNGTFDGWGSNLDYDGAFSNSYDGSKNNSAILHEKKSGSIMSKGSSKQNNYSLNAGGSSSSISNALYERMQHKRVSSEAKKVAYFLRSQRYIDSYEHHRDLAGRKPFYIPTNDPILDESFVSSKLNVKGGLSMLQMEEVAASPVWNRHASINRRSKKKKYPIRKLPSIKKMKQFQSSILKKYSIKERPRPKVKTVEDFEEDVKRSGMDERGKGGEETAIEVPPATTIIQQQQQQSLSSLPNNRRSMKHNFSFQTLYSSKKKNRQRLSMGFPTVEKKKEKRRHRRGNRGTKLFLTEEDGAF